MKFRITLKDPDGFYDGMEDAAKAMVPDSVAAGLTEDQLEDVEDDNKVRISDFLEKWVEYDEYVELEFDMDAGTAVVVERSD